MKVRFYSFTKRKNSTKIPANTDTYTELDCTLKEETSILRPSLLVAGNNFNYNYCYIPSFGRYYFIEDVRSYAQGLTLFELSIDYLGSHKTAVGNTRAMILRSSTGYNEWIPDDEVYVSTEKTVVRVADDFNVGFANHPGCYLLSVINEDGSSVGFTAQYYADSASLKMLANQLMNTSFVQDVMKYSSNVSAGIVSLKWMPFDFDDIITMQNRFVTLSNYKISNVELNCAGYLFTGTNYFLDGNVSIPIPWRTDQDFREASPYTSMKLLVPMYGLVELNSSDFVGAENINIQYRVDRSTGDVVLLINRDEPGQLIQTIQFNVAVEIPVATLTRNIGGMVSSISGGVNSAIGIAAGNYIGGTAGLISAASSFALSANGRSVSLKGNLEGKSPLAYGPVFQLILYVPHTLDPTNANFISTKGRPCQYVDTISNHSGYILCESASVLGNMLNQERDGINSFLNGGFYYE